MEHEGVLENVRENEPVFRGMLDSLRDIPIVGDVRGDGYFFGIELVKDNATKTTFDDAESERLLRGFLSGALGKKMGLAVESAKSASGGRVYRIVEER